LTVRWQNYACKNFDAADLIRYIIAIALFFQKDIVTSAFSILKTNREVSVFAN